MHLQIQLGSPNTGDFARNKSRTGGEIQELWNTQLAKSPYQPGVPHPPRGSRWQVHKILQKILVGMAELAVKVVHSLACMVGNFRLNRELKSNGKEIKLQVWGQWQEWRESRQKCRNYARCFATLICYTFSLGYDFNSQKEQKGGLQLILGTNRCFWRFILASTEAIN